MIYHLVSLLSVEADFQVSCMAYLFPFCIRLLGQLITNLGQIFGEFLDFIVLFFEETHLP